MTEQIRTNPNKSEQIDFIRGFAITTIVCMHLLYRLGCPIVVNHLISFGGAGVHAFFFCSGFGLYLSYLKKPLGYGSFLKKRFSKIYWPYFIVILLYLLKNVIEKQTINWTEYLSHLFLFKMFDSDLDVSLCYPFWFISTIIQFYLFWPLIVKLKEHKYGLFLSLLISVVWWIFVAIIGAEEKRPYASFFLQYLWEFVLGMQVAVLYRDGNNVFDFPIGRTIIIAIVGIGLTGFMGIAGGSLKLFNDIPSFLGYTSLALLLYKLSVKSVNQFFTFTNKVSYEWYLLHSFVFAVLTPYLKGSNVVLYVGVCLVLSYISALLYDRALRCFGLK